MPRVDRLISKIKMTKFQALFVLYLRHEQFCGCSWRALSANFYNRYYGEDSNEVIPINKRKSFEITTTGGNQLDGMNLEKIAFEILLKEVDPIIIGMNYDLYECDLTYIDANLKRHIK